MTKLRIIFILANIYESINGVSTKYLKFIHFLINLSHDVILITTFKDKTLYDKLEKRDNLTICKVSGLNIPFYKEIKIPIISENKIKKYINDGNEIIIFNGEFIWIYETLKSIKNKYKDIKLYPTMHTDYVFYNEYIYSKYNFTSVLNHLNHYLETKVFNGIIVTGEKMKNKYINYTDNIFNANEVNLNIFKNYKIDKYTENTLYNLIYCGRISKEKNIEEILECCLALNEKYSFNLNIIGSGPFTDNLKDIIDIKFKKIKTNIIFLGSKEAIEINTIYQTLVNRIFIFTSISETFGKTPMEAGATGIPIFIKESEITDNLYINKKNAFIFNDSKSFVQLFDYFVNLDEIEKQLLINNSINNIKKYDQNIIFNEWIIFLSGGVLKKEKQKINLMDMLSFYGMAKLINCSGSILAD
jgi:glycosyltransferase involved in cell wall biosynthesis